jgi:hypothetical protein
MIRSELAGIVSAISNQNLFRVRLAPDEVTVSDQIFYLQSLNFFGKKTPLARMTAIFYLL